MNKKILYFSLSLVLFFLITIIFNRPVKSAEQADLTQPSSFCNLTPDGAPTGNVTIGSSCVIYEDVNGVANGNLTLSNNSTLTLHRNLVWYPGYKITIQPGSKIFINSNSKMVQGKICVKDVDGNGYPTAKVITSDPATGNTVTNTVLTQIDSTISATAPYTCNASDGYYPRENLTSLAYVDNTSLGQTNGELFTGDNIFLSMGFSINNIVDANAASGDIIVPGSKDLIVLRSLQVNLGATVSGNLQVGYSAQPLTAGQAIFSGNVGIGTTNPGYKLDVKTAQNNGVRFLSVGGGTQHLIMDGALTTNQSIELNRTSGGATDYLKIVKTLGAATFDSDSQLRFNIAGSQKMTLDTTGNVSIGKTTPGSTTKLDIYNLYDTNTTGSLYNTYNRAVLADIALTGNVALYGTVSIADSQNMTPMGNTVSITGVYASARVNTIGLGGSFATNAYGLYAAVDVSDSIGDLQNGYGVYAAVSKTGGAAAALANGYGVYIPTVSATEAYGIYQTGGTKNYFADAIGIATTTPSTPLHVATYSTITLTTNPYSGASSVTAAWATGITNATRNTSILASNAIVGGSFFGNSDARLKENVTPIENDLVDTFLSKAKPVLFDWKESKNIDSGFIAQDLIKDGFEYLVSASPNDKIEATKDASGFISPAGQQYTVNYSSIVPILAAAIQKQNTKLSNLNLETNEKIVINNDNTVLTTKGITNQIIAIAKAFVGKLNAGIIETKQLLVDGIDVMKKITDLNNKIDNQQKQIDELKKQIEDIKKSI